MINISTEHMILTEVFDFKHIKELNGCERIYFETLHELKNEEVIYYADCVFIVKNIEKTLVGERIIYAIEALEKFYCDMIDLFEYSETTATLSLSKACDIVFAGTGWTYMLESNLTSVAFENFGNDSKSALFQTVLKRYKREFEVDYKNKNIYIAREIGKDESVVFRYKKNIVAISETVDTKELTTYIEAEGKDGLYVKYTSDNAEKFGVRHAKKIKDERYVNIEELTEYARQSIQDVPLVAFEVDALVIDEDLSLGDKVFVIHEKLGIDIHARVLAIEEMPLDRQKRKTIKLGNFVEVCFSDRVISKVEDYFDATSQADKELQAKIDAANAAIDKEYNDRVQAVTDAIAKAEADAEAMKQQIDSEIQADFEIFNEAWQQADAAIENKVLAESARITTEISDRKQAVTNAINTANSNAQGFANTVQENLDALGNASTTQKIHGNAMVTGSLGADKIIANSITAGQIKSGSITANLMAADSVVAGSLKVDQAFIDKLTVTDMLAQKITTNSLFATTVQTVALNADKITTGTLNADLIKTNTLKGDRILAGSISADKIIANSITAGQIDVASVKTVILTADAVTAATLKVDQALINKLTVDDLLTNAITAKQAFITSVQAIDFQAERVVGGYLRSTNGSYEQNLNSGETLYKTGSDVSRIKMGDFYDVRGLYMQAGVSNAGTELMLSKTGMAYFNADHISLGRSSQNAGFKFITNSYTGTTNPAANRIIPWTAGTGSFGQGSYPCYEVRVYNITDLYSVNRVSTTLSMHEAFQELNALEVVDSTQVNSYITPDQTTQKFNLEDDQPKKVRIGIDFTNLRRSRSVDSTLLFNEQNEMTLNTEIAILWKAVQELSAQINELKGA